MGTSPSHFQGSSAEVSRAEVHRRPVERISWEMINEVGGFLDRTGMRLPTEAEWEFAYRAGSSTAFHGTALSPEGTNEDPLVGSIAWFGSCCNGNSVHQTRPVGGRLANGLGLHDMSGNVFEWVADWYSATYYSQAPSQDPSGPTTGSYHVARGGSWLLDSYHLRASARYPVLPNVQRHDVGFRTAKSP